MAPPSKRRKRNIVTSDDEEDNNPPVNNTLAKYLLTSPDAKDSSSSIPNTSRDIATSPIPIRKSSRINTNQPPKPPLKPLQSFSANRSSGNSTYKSVASASPQKNRSRPPVKKPVEEKGKTADLVSLFSRQAERAATRPVKRPPPQLDDIISDPISDDDDVGEHRAVAASQIGMAARKRQKDSQVGNNNASSSAPVSQKFMLPPPLSRDFTSDDDQRPWSERFGPVNLDELAVHKRKVADVRKWLDDVMAGRLRQRLLILKGAAGTGKTTTLRLLARDMRCELLEWRNPTGSLGGPGSFQSASMQFEEFMGRGGKFSQLETGDEDPSPKNNAISDGLRKIMLIEEFPNTFTPSSTAITSFRKAILQFLAMNTPSLSPFEQQTPRGPITPVVMIISESLLTTTSAAADSFTAHRLLGPEIMRHPGTCIIEFKAIAPTLLAAALERIVQKEAKKTGRRRTPGPQVLKKLGEIGDIRSAISSLQFLCLKGDAEGEWGSQVSFSKPKRSIKNSVSLTQGEVETLQLISQRESSLGIFHAVGKVVYNKRDDLPMNSQSVEERAEVLPDYMASCSRPKKSEVSVDSLMDETGTDAHTFISALHENYVLSCDPTSPADSSSFLDYMDGCIDYLSDSDLLCPSWDIFFGGRNSGASGFSARDSASHVLRQEEITFQVATRGLLFSLPNPVKRIVTGSRRGGGDAFKMFYPTSLKLWREKEELEGLVDHWSSVLLKGGGTGQNVTDGASAFQRPKTTATGQWLGSQSSRRDIPHVKQTEPSQNQPAALLSLGSSARREMILERLPYMAHIARRRRIPAPAVRLKDMERVVSFSGIGAAADEDAMDVEESLGVETGEAWATDKPTEETSPRKKKTLRIQHGDATSASVASLQVQKLVLSDDDIEDD